MDMRDGLGWGGALLILLLRWQGELGQGHWLLIYNPVLLAKKDGVILDTDLIMGVGCLQESRLGQLLQCRIVLQIIASLHSFTRQLAWKQNSWACPACKAYLEPCPLAPATLASFTSNPHDVPSPPQVPCALCLLLWSSFFLFLVNYSSIRVWALPQTSSS